MLHRFLLAVSLGTALFLLGCERSAGPDSETSVNVSELESVLRRGIDGEPETLDPALAVTTADFEILFDLFEGLTTESADGEVVPGAAESWDVSEDGTEYTFAIRADARWSNGDPLLATDFVAAFRRVVNPATGSGNAFFLLPIQNAEEITEGRLTPEQLMVDALDARTLKITLTAPTQYFLKLLSHSAAFPLHPSAIAGKGNAFSNPASYISNGAYTLDEWRPLNHIRLQRNDFYWGRESVRIQTVVHYPNVDSNAEFDRFRAGELDITSTIPPEKFSIAAAEYADAIHVAPSLALYYYAFDMTEAPFDNRDLRQALSMVIDRDRLVEILGRGETAAKGFVPPGVANYGNASYSWAGWSEEKRVRTARELYAAAGYSEQNPLELEVSFNTGDVHATVALIVSEMWRENLGVRTNLNGVEWQLLLAMRDDRASWEVMRFSWTGDYNDANTFVEILRSDSPQNLPAYINSEYDRLVADAAVTQDPEMRRGMLESAENLMLDDYPVLPLYFPVSKHLVNPRIRNFRPNVLDHHFSRFYAIENVVSH